MLRTLFGCSKQRSAAATTRAAALGAGALVRMQFSVDQRTNSIIAAGTRDDLAVVEAILLRLDQGDIREREHHRLPAEECVSRNDVSNTLNNWLQTRAHRGTERPARDQPVRADRPRSDHRARVGQQQPGRQRHAAVLQGRQRADRAARRAAADGHDPGDDRRSASSTIPTSSASSWVCRIRCCSTDRCWSDVDHQYDDHNAVLPRARSPTPRTSSAPPLNPGFNFNNQPLGNNGQHNRRSQRGARSATQGLTELFDRPGQQRAGLRRVRVLGLQQ